MKKYLIFLLIASFFGLLSCNKEDDGRLDYNRQIKLQASVEPTLVIRNTGPITSAFTTDFPIGVFAHNGSWLAGASANVINNDTAVVAGAGAHNITFGDGPYFYPSDGSYITFFAFAPRGTVVTPPGAGTPPMVNISITGRTDVLWATNRGRKVGSAPAENPVLNFAHKLTQLQFTFKSASTGYPAAGNRVVSLKVMAQPNVVAMNVENGTYTSSGNTDMEALSQVNQTNGIEITLAGNNANSPIMTVPVDTSIAYNLTVVVRPQGSATTVSYTGSIVVDAEMG